MADTDGALGMSQLHHKTSVADLTNVLLAEWQQIPAARFQKVVKSLPEEWTLNVFIVVRVFKSQIHIVEMFWCPYTFGH